MRKWDDLPIFMKTAEVKHYYDLLNKKRFGLFIKRAFDILVSSLLLIFLAPLFLIISISIKIDSDGPVFYRQVRVTRYGEEFRIFKFRTMVTGADKGSLLTVSQDSRVTRVGRILRKYKIDELSQLIDVFRGTMSFVGTRPEVPKYVDKYTPEMMATLLMPAGITSEASVFYKDENELLDNSSNPEEVYVNKILPDKMHYNLKSIENFSIFNDISIMIKTVLAVFIKDSTTDKKSGSLN